MRELFGQDVTDLVALPDGQVVAIGRHPEASLGIARFERDGSLDEGFVRRASWEIAGRLTGRPDQVVVLGDGKIVVAGDFHFDGSFGLIRASQDGQREEVQIPRVCAGMRRRARSGSSRSPSCPTAASS